MKKTKIGPKKIILLTPFPRNSNTLIYFKTNYEESYDLEVDS